MPFIISFVGEEFVILQLVSLATYFLFCVCEVLGGKRAKFKFQTLFQDLFKLCQAVSVSQAFLCYVFCQPLSFKETLSKQHLELIHNSVSIFKVLQCFKEKKSIVPYLAQYSNESRAGWFSMRFQSCTVMSLTLKSP